MRSSSVSSPSSPSGSSHDEILVLEHRGLASAGLGRLRHRYLLKSVACIIASRPPAKPTKVKPPAVIADTRHRPYSLCGPGEAVVLYPLRPSAKLRERRAKRRTSLPSCRTPFPECGRLSARHRGVFGRRAALPDGPFGPPSASSSQGARSAPDRCLRAYPRRRDASAPRPRATAPPRRVCPISGPLKGASSSIRRQLDEASLRTDQAHRKMRRIAAD